MFFVNNFWTMQDRASILTTSCFSRQDASNGIHDDLVGSRSKFDLRSRSRVDPNRSCCISVDAD